MRYSVLVDRRLQGERWMVPARSMRGRSCCGRAAARPGGLVKILNGLKYDAAREVPGGAGEFAVGEKGVVFLPAPGRTRPTSRCSWRSRRTSMKELRGAALEEAVSRRRRSSPSSITYLFDESREKRRLVRYEELPEHLVKAVLAIEDRRFFSHPGLDPLRIAAAAIRNSAPRATSRAAARSPSSCARTSS